MSLIYTAQQLTIYSGIFLIITGIGGNGLNILAFSSVRTYRTNPCSFYFLMNSIDNLVYIAINLISRIMMTGYGIDLTQTSLAWCKMRAYLILVLSLTSFTTSCLPSIDQFFITSKSVYLRSLSNIKSAHRIVFIAIIVWILHGIPALIYLDISPITNSCVNTNPTYVSYGSIYVLIYSCIIPIFIMVTFGYLTYRNIHQTRALAEQQADRQLTKMTLMQVILVVTCLIPFGIFQIYVLSTSTLKKDADRILKELFTTTFMNLSTYIYYSGSCYIFLISSSRFRRTIRDRILFWQRPNRVNPFSHLILARPTTRNRANT